MMKDDETRKLFNEFPPISTPEWEQAILKDLKGADYAKKLIWTSPEGIQVKPYYRAEDLEKLKSSDFNPLEFGFLKADDGRSNSWLIRQDIEITDFDQAKEKALWFIERGAQSIGFNLEEPHTARATKL